MRTAVYIRVSSNEQAKEGYSLQAQDARCKSFIESQGWEYVKTYMDDGFSAKNLNRPAMQEMLEDMKEHLFDAIVVYRLDRLTRSVSDLHYLLEEFDEHKVAFKSVTEAFETATATGRLFVNLTASVAEWERQNLGERVIVGMERKAQEGKRVGSRAPYGYDLLDGKLIVNDAEAAIVRRIFEMYKTKGMLSICKVLNSEGITTKNGEFNTYSIKFILENPVYIGKLRWNHKKGKDKSKIIISDGDHEPIIDEVLFNQVQDLIKERQVKGAKALTSNLPYSGILKCARCGSSISGQVNRRPGMDDYYNYCCSNVKHKGNCDLPNMSERVLDHVVIKKTSWKIDTSQIDTESKDRSNEEKRAIIEKEIEKIRRRRKNYQIAFGDGQITLDELRELTADDREREEQFQKELEAIPMVEPIQQIDPDEFNSRMNDLKQVWEYASRQERKELLHAFFQEIVVDVLDEPMWDWPKKRGRIPRQVKIVDFKLRY